MPKSIIGKFFGIIRPSLDWLHSHYNLDICILQFDNQLEKDLSLINGPPLSLPSTPLPYPLHPSLSSPPQVSMEDVQGLMRRYGVLNWIEMSARNLSNLGKLERIFVALSRQMVSVRESMEVTRSGKKNNVITLSDDWELITAPDDPVPHYAYQAQDQQLRAKLNCRC